jgi:hypothetical protein
MSGDPKNEKPGVIKTAFRVIILLFLVFSFFYLLRLHWTTNHNLLSYEFASEVNRRMAYYVIFSSVVAFFSHIALIFILLRRWNFLDKICAVKNSPISIKIKKYINGKIKK